MIIHALQTGTIFVYEIFIVYAVIVHQTNISYSNAVPSAKHVQSNGKAGRVSYISLLFHTPWFCPSLFGGSLEITCSVPLIKHLVNSNIAIKPGLQIIIPILNET